LETGATENVTVGEVSSFPDENTLFEGQQRHRETRSKTRVEAGSNTFTVTLRVVGGDEKRSLKSETVKYGHEYQGTRTRERLRWQGPAAHTKDRLALSSERAPHGNKSVTVKQQKKYLVMSSRWGLDTKTY
jgi:hypothetical protein